MAAIFRRFGFARNLSFVLPPGNKIYAGWPYVIDEGFYRVKKTAEFNILCDHAVYNEQAMQKIMPNNSVYITTIRHPANQIISLFYYYKVHKIAEVTGPNPISEYLQNFELYETRYKSHEAKHRYCIPDGLSMVRNPMAFSLGFPTGFPAGTKDLTNDSSAVASWIKHISDKFKVILLVEYIDESLVLLKRLLCWKTKDILYFTINKGTYDHHDSSNVIDNETSRLHRTISAVDYALYEHFEKIFHKRISQQQNFNEDVTNFQQIRKTFQKFCDNTNQSLDNISIESSKWNEKIVLTRLDCQNDRSRMMDEVKNYYDNLPPSEIKQPEASRVVC